MSALEIAVTTFVVAVSMRMWLSYWGVKFPPRLDFGMSLAWVVFLAFALAGCGALEALATGGAAPTLDAAAEGAEAAVVAAQEIGLLEGSTALVVASMIIKSLAGAWLRRRRSPALPGHPKEPDI